MKEVYTYHDLRELPNLGYFEELRRYPHITATSEMKEVLNEDPRFGFVDNAASFSMLLKWLVPGWRSQSDRFERMALASRFWREIVSSESDEFRRERLKGLRRRLSDFISAITLLVESGIGPRDVPQIDENIEQLVRLWDYLITNGDMVSDVNTLLDSSLDEISPGITGIDQVMHRMFTHMGSKTVVLHGFYFITPIQKRVFDLMEESGYTLIYLVNYDFGYPYAYEVWERTYSPDFGFPEKGEWIKDPRHAINPMGEVFEGRRPSADNIRVSEHRTIIDLVTDVMISRRNGKLVYTPDEEGANEILKNFFPDVYGQMSLSSYPVGQFLTALYRMWNDDKETLTLDIDNLKSCFATGWLNTDSYRSTDCLFDLEGLTPFLEGCETLDEWMSVFNLISKARSEITPLFHEDSEDRWGRVMSNPLSNVGALSVPRDKLAAISEMVVQLIDMARTLFSDTDVILQDHLGTVDCILKGCVKTPDLEDEYAMMRLFLEKVGDRGFSRVYRPCDLRDSMRMLLSERPEESDDHGSREVVKPISEVDVSSIQGCGISIILSDVSRMPGTYGRYLWPLSSSIIGAIHQSVDECRKGLLDALSNVMESVPLRNRYLFFNALGNNSVSISWVRTLDDKTMQPSPFIGLLQEFAGVKIETMGAESIAVKHISEVKPVLMDLGDFDITEGVYCSNDAKMDYALCPLRFLYGYVLNDHPSYSSDFHLQFVISNMISAFRRLCPEYDADHVTNNVLDLFPYLNGSERRQIMDYSRIAAPLGMTEFADRNYTDLRLKVLFPTQRMLELAQAEFGKLYTPDGRRGLEITDHTEFKDVCKYCQHSEYCRRVVFSIDQEDVYDGDSID